MAEIFPRFQDSRVEKRDDSAKQQIRGRVAFGVSKPYCQLSTIARRAIYRILTYNATQQWFLRALGEESGRYIWEEGGKDVSKFLTGPINLILRGISHFLKFGQDRVCVLGESSLTKSVFGQDSNEATGHGAECEDNFRELNVLK